MRIKKREILKTAVVFSCLATLLSGCSLANPKWGEENAGSCMAGVILVTGEENQPEIGKNPEGRYEDSEGSVVFDRISGKLLLPYNELDIPRFDKYLNIVSSGHATENGITVKRMQAQLYVTEEFEETLKVYPVYRRGDDTYYVGLDSPSAIGGMVKPDGPGSEYEFELEEKYQLDSKSTQSFQMCRIGITVKYVKGVREAVATELDSDYQPVKTYAIDKESSKLMILDEKTACVELEVTEEDGFRRRTYLYPKEGERNIWGTIYWDDEDGLAYRSDVLWNAAGENPAADK